MARVARSEHEKIRRSVDMDHIPVAEVASLYGCSPATVYGILARLRREGGGGDETPHSATGTPELSIDAAPKRRTASTPPGPAAEELFNGATGADAAAPGASIQPVRELAPQPGRDDNAKPAPTSSVSAQLVSGTSSEIGSAGAVTPFMRRGNGKGGVGGKLAKPGCGLVMRMPDGEETTTPFRTVEDMLSAIKPILRTAARSSEPVWFSVQPIDLAAVDSDAA